MGIGLKDAERQIDSLQDICWVIAIFFISLAIGSFSVSILMRVEIVGITSAIIGACVGGIIFWILMYYIGYFKYSYMGK